MQCIIFHAPRAGTLDLRLCSEILSYSPGPSFRVDLTTTLVVKCLAEEPAYVRALYRGYVGDLVLQAPERWKEQDDPFASLCYNLPGAPPNNTITLRPLSFRDRTQLKLGSRRVRVLVPGGLTSTEPIRQELSDIGLRVPNLHYCPYSLWELGPFQGQGRHFAVRYTVAIGPEAFNRAVTEDLFGGVRLHRIYDTEDGPQRAQYVDLPRLKVAPDLDPRVYAAYARMLGTAIRGPRLIPEHYVLGIMAPNGQLSQNCSRLEVVGDEGSIMALPDALQEKLDVLGHAHRQRGLHFFFARRGAKGLRLQIRTVIPVEDRLLAWRTTLGRRR